MSERAIHFVGSIPGSGAQAVIRDSLRQAGSGVRSITDGETGERSRWIVHIIESFRRHPGFELRRDGDWSSYDTASMFRLRRGYRLTAEDLDLGHVAAFQESYPEFRRVREELGYDGVSFQVGIPGDLDLALFTFGVFGAFRHRRPFTEALVQEITEIHREAGSDVVFQIEIPAELVFMTKVPGPVRPAMAAFLSRGVRQLVREAPPGARFGVHLCVGDLGNKALGRLTDVRPLVRLAHAIVSRWPAEHPLEFVHAPFSGGDRPAPLDPRFYAALADLTLPPETRFVAGFVHERRSLAQLRETLALIEDRYGRPVDVAAACGLGRRTAEQATANINLSRELRTT